MNSLPLAPVQRAPPAQPVKTQIAAAWFIVFAGKVRERGRGGGGGGAENPPQSWDLYAQSTKTRGMKWKWNGRNYSVLWDPGGVVGGCDVTAGLGRVRSPRGEEGGGGNLTKGVASSGTNAEPCSRVQRLKKRRKKSVTHHSHVE